MQFEQDEMRLVQELTEEYNSYRRLNHLALMSDYAVFRPSLLDLEASYHHLIKGFEYTRNKYGGDIKTEIGKSISHLHRANKNLLDFIFIQKINEFDALVKKADPNMLKVVRYEEIYRGILGYKEWSQNKELDAATKEDIDRFILLIKRIDDTKPILMEASIKNSLSEQIARQREDYSLILIIITAILLGMLLGPFVIRQFT